MDTTENFHNTESGCLNTETTNDMILRIYEEIKDLIIRREILPDEKINQNQIACKLNVSRTPVIKALHMLKSEGLVDNVPNKGFYVHSASLQDTVELYELRQAVEMVAVANTAEYADMDDILELREIFIPFMGVNEIDPIEYAKTDRQFHSRIIELSNNNLLQRTNQSILLLPKAYTLGLLRSPRETLPEHLDIVDAMLRRDVAQAQSLAQIHLAITIKILKKTMESLKSIGVDARKIPVSDVSSDYFSKISIHKETRK